MNTRLFVRLVREQALRLTRQYPRLSMTAAIHEAFTRLAEQLDQEASGAPYRCLNGHDHDDPWAAQLCNDLVHEARRR